MNKDETPLQTGTYHTAVLGGKRAQYRILKKDDRKILIPVWEVPEDLETGDSLEVFVFLDGKEGLKGTTQKAHAELGDFAALKVKSVTDFGVFLDWGIKKDLFAPRKLLRKDHEVGDTAVVCLIPDFDGVGVIASGRIDEYFEKEKPRLKEGSKADLLVFGISDLGYRVVVNNCYKGLLYRNEVFEPLKIGDRRKGYIKKLRPDGLIDAALQAQGYKMASNDASDIIMKALEEAGGFLPLHDKSDPDKIKRYLKMSKKNFKKATGLLYREKKILLEERGIRKV
jgi:predicted RNA-binding protein (virulence factor B family)